MVAVKDRVPPRSPNRLKYPSSDKQDPLKDVHLDLLIFLKRKYTAFKVYIHYLVFGFITTLISIVSFYILLEIGMDYKLANIISFILAILFAYITNKHYVFEKKSETLKELVKEAIHFSMVRTGSFFFEFTALVVCVSYLDFNKIISKTVITIIVIVFNFLISRFFIFKEHHS